MEENSNQIYTLDNNFSNIEIDEILNFSDIKKRLLNLEDNFTDGIGKLIKENIDLKQKNEILETEIKELKIYVEKQIEIVKVFAKGLTGNRVFVLPNTFKSINTIDGGDEVTEILGITNEFDLDTLPGLKDSGLIKFKLKEKLIFFRNGTEIVFVKEAIEILKLYGYEIVYDYSDKTINLNSHIVEYK